MTLLIVGVVAWAIGIGVTAIEVRRHGWGGKTPESEVPR